MKKSARRRSRAFCGYSGSQQAKSLGSFGKCVGVADWAMGLVGVRQNVYQHPGTASLKASSGFAPNAKARLACFGGFYPVV